jgi:hypothetical protein
MSALLPSSGMGNEPDWWTPQNELLSVTGSSGIICSFRLTNLGFRPVVITGCRIYSWTRATFLARFVKTAYLAQEPKWEDKWIHTYRVLWRHVFRLKVGKVKQTLYRPTGFQKFEARFRNNRHLRVVRLSAAFTPQKIFVVHTSVGGWVELTAIVNPEVLRQRKIPITYQELKTCSLPACSAIRPSTAPSCAPLKPKHIFRYTCDQSTGWHSVSQSVTCLSSVSMECSPKDCETRRIFLKMTDWFW